MPKVKMILIQDSTSYDDYDSYSKSIIRDSLSDWEEITDEELLLLRRNAHRLIKWSAQNGDYRPLIVVQDEVPVAEHIENIRRALRLEVEKQEKEKAAREKKKAEAAAKKLAKKVASDAVKYEALVVQHGEEKAKTIWEFLQKAKKV